MLTGTTVRPVADREKVAHEELAYVVDSTASPVATIIPFNVWPVYVAGLIAIPSMSHFIPDQDAAIGMFLRAIPFNFYGIFAVLFTLLFALDKLPFVGKTMRRAQRRARETGELDSPHAEPVAAKELTSVNVADGYKPSLLDFFTPIADDPYDFGWIVKVKLQDDRGVDQLMDFDAYKKQCAESA